MGLRRKTQKVLLRRDLNFGNKQEVKEVNKKNF